MIFGSEVHPENVPTRGIREITIDDIYFTKKMKLAVKLIAYARRSEKGGFACGVEPMVLPVESMMASVSDVYNAVLVQGDMLGDVMFYGKGAGKLPTASAVVADIIDAAKLGSSIHDSLFWRPTAPLKGKITDVDSYTYYVRVNNLDVETLKEDLGGVVLTLQHQNQTAVLTLPMSAREMEKRKEKTEKGRHPSGHCAADAGSVIAWDRGSRYARPRRSQISAAVLTRWGLRWPSSTPSRWRSGTPSRSPAPTAAGRWRGRRI